jgi:deoxyribose-phosphate aldolase
MHPSALATFLQYTNVQPEATWSEIRIHCEQAAECGFHAVMIQPCWISLAKEILRGTQVKVASAVAYPMGGETTSMKVALAREVVRLGADEFDFQPNIGFLRSGMVSEFLVEVKEVVAAADGRPVKSMSEFGYLNHEERVLAVTLAEEGGVSYVKNSSGIGPGGSPATVEEIRFICEHLTGRAKVKASGGIKNYAQAMTILEAGAHLIGSSAAPAIIGGKSGGSGSY